MCVGGTACIHRRGDATAKKQSHRHNTQAHVRKSLIESRKLARVLADSTRKVDVVL